MAIASMWLLYIDLIFWIHVPYMVNSTPIEANLSRMCDSAVMKQFVKLLKNNPTK